MIKNVPIIYPNELFYSFLCRTYVRSGVGSSREFTKLVFHKGTDLPKTGFINKLNDDFKEKLNNQVSDMELICGHTVFNFYSRFLSSAEKEKAVKEIVNGKNSFNYIHIPASKDEMYLRYCPECVNEDRKKYGEAYFHIEHQLEKVRICVHHKCKLLNTELVNGCKNQMTLKPLEVCELNEIVDYVSDESIEFMVSKYIYDFLMCDFTLESNIDFAKLLENKLDSKYFLSERCKRKNLDLLYDDIKEFYKDYELFNISKRRLAAILRGIEYNSFDILLISFFEGLTVNEICNIVLDDKTRSEEFDKKVIKLYDDGNSYLKISQIMDVDKETIRKIILKKNCKTIAKINEDA